MIAGELRLCADLGSANLNRWRRWPSPPLRAASLICCSSSAVSADERSVAVEAWRPRSAGLAPGSISRSAIAGWRPPGPRRSP